MASYESLGSLFDDEGLKLKVQSAVIIAVKNLLTGTPTANDRAFSDVVFDNPGAMAQKVLMFVLAANNSATVEDIQGASDPTIQTNVNTVIPELVKALAGI